MKVIGRNMIGIYLCVPDENDYKNIKTVYDALVLGLKTGWYINPKNCGVIL
jgi:hypothetical protein